MTSQETQPTEVQPSLRTRSHAWHHESSTVCCPWTLLLLSHPPDHGDCRLNAHSVLAVRKAVRDAECGSLVVDDTCRLSRTPRRPTWRRHAACALMRADRRSCSPFPVLQGPVLRPQFARSTTTPRPVLHPGPALLRSWAGLL